VLATSSACGAAIGAPAFAPSRQSCASACRPRCGAPSPGWRGTALVAIVARRDRSPLAARDHRTHAGTMATTTRWCRWASAHDLLGKIAKRRARHHSRMGHDLPDVLLPRIAAGIAENAARAVQGLEAPAALAPLATPTSIAGMTMNTSSISRRQWLALASSSGAGLALPDLALAQAWPTRAIRFVVPLLPRAAAARSWPAALPSSWARALRPIGHMWTTKPVAPAMSPCRRWPGRTISTR